jgi:hypothetical protein
MGRIWMHPLHLHVGGSVSGTWGPEALPALFSMYAWEGLETNDQEDGGLVVPRQNYPLPY